MRRIRSVIHAVHTTDQIEIRTHADADTDMGQSPSSKTYGYADFGLTQKKFSYLATSQIILCCLYRAL
jgi:hypothetical protein